MKRSNEVFNRKILKYKRRILPQPALSLFLTIVLLFIGSDGATQENRLRIHFIDVGYGDAIFIQLPDSHTILIDAGEKAHTRQLLDYLQSLNIHTIDQAVITHPHKNHFEGFFEILKYFSIHQLAINGEKEGEEGYEKLLESFRDKQIPIKELSRGMTFSGLSKSVKIEVLHPGELTGSTNGNSLVLWLKHQEISVLFMADIELKEQDQLIALYPKLKQANSIKIPHHGGPLSDEFIRSFTDKNFIISTGPNPWGLPYEHDVKKLKGVIFRTDYQGTIILESDGLSVSIKTVEDNGD